jgi:hypothetical protein
MSRVSRIAWEGIPEVGAVDMVAVRDLLNHIGELAAVSAAETGAEDRRHLVSSELPQAKFATALEQLVDRKVALEDEVAAILDLRDGIEAGKVDRLALLGGELRPQHQRPIVEPLADDVRAQPVGSGLQRRDVIHRQERIVVLAEADLRAGELSFDEAVAVKVIGGLEREERGHPHHHRTQHFVVDVEVIMGEAAALVGEDTVVRVLRGIFRHADAEGRSLLHALEDEVDAVAAASDHTALPRQNMVFLAHALLGPFDRKAVVAGERLDSVLVIGGAPAQHSPPERRRHHGRSAPPARAATGCGDSHE